MTKNLQSQGAKSRLLAVDDNRLILRVITDHFVPRGWDVTTAESVASARASLSSSVPDVIISDILMPDVDGWTFFEEVRKRKETSTVPFVFLTVERDLPKRLKGLQLGADDYMTKPFAVEELEARIERLLERSAAMKAAAEGGGDAQLTGSLEHLAISDLLQMLALNGKNGTVRLQRRREGGRIEFEGGRIVDAQVGSARGVKALYRMLGWTDAQFRVVARDGEITEATIGTATSTLLMEGLVSLDEWNRWHDLLPGPEQRLELTVEARSLMHGQPLRPAELDLLPRAKKGTTVAEAIENSPLPDAQIAEAICTLLARGALRAVAEGSQAETA
jgi:DNA-binding response OmpR family regulator